MSASLKTVHTHGPSKHECDTHTSGHQKVYRTAVLRSSLQLIARAVLCTYTCNYTCSNTHYTHTHTCTFTYTKVS